MRSVGLDLAGQRERGLELRADPDAGADLLGEHLVALDAVLGQGVELRLEFLGERRAAGVPDADVGGRGVRREGVWDRGAGAPRLAGPAVGGGGTRRRVTQGSSAAKASTPPAPEAASAAVLAP